MQQGWRSQTLGWIFFYWRIRGACHWPNSRINCIKEVSTKIIATVPLGWESYQCPESVLFISNKSFLFIVLSLFSSIQDYPLRIKICLVRFLCFANSSFFCALSLANHRNTQLNANTKNQASNHFIVLGRLCSLFLYG